MTGRGARSLSGLLLSSVSLTGSSTCTPQVREPEPAPLPAEGAGDSAAPGHPAAGMPPGIGGPDSNDGAAAGDQDGALLRMHFAMQPTRSQSASPSPLGYLFDAFAFIFTSVFVSDDGSYGDAVAAALRKYFRAAPRLLLPGDTFGVALPPVGQLDGVLATLSGGGSGAADGGGGTAGGSDSCAADGSSEAGGSYEAGGSGDTEGSGAAAAAAQLALAALQPGGGGGKLVFFKVTELRPAPLAAAAALAIDPGRTAISLQVRLPAPINARKSNLCGS